MCKSITWDDVVRKVSNDRILLEILAREARRKQRLLLRDDRTAHDTWSEAVQYVVSTAFMVDSVVNVLKGLMQLCTGGRQGIEDVPCVLAVEQTLVGSVHGFKNEEEVICSLSEVQGMKAQKYLPHHRCFESDGQSCLGNPMHITDNDVRCSPGREIDDGGSREMPTAEGHEGTHQNPSAQGNGSDNRGSENEHWPNYEHSSRTFSGSSCVERPELYPSVLAKRGGCPSGRVSDNDCHEDSLDCYVDDTGASYTRERRDERNKLFSSNGDKQQPSSVTDKTPPLKHGSSSNMGEGGRLAAAAAAAETSGDQEGLERYRDRGESIALPSEHTSEVNSTQRIPEPRPEAGATYHCAEDNAKDGGVHHWENRVNEEIEPMNDSGESGNVSPNEPLCLSSSGRIPDPMAALFVGEHQEGQAGNFRTDRGANEESKPLIYATKKNVRFLDEALCTVYEIRATFEPHEVEELFYSADDLDRMSDEAEDDREVERKVLPRSESAEDNGIIPKDSSLGRSIESAIGEESLDELLFDSYKFDEGDSDECF